MKLSKIPCKKNQVVDRSLLVVGINRFELFVKII